MPRKEKKSNKVGKSDEDTRKRKFRWTKIFQRNIRGSATKGDHREQRPLDKHPLSPAKTLHQQQLKLISNPIIPGEPIPAQVQCRHPTIANDNRERRSTANQILKPRPGAPVLRTKQTKRITTSKVVNNRCSVVEILDRNKKKNTPASTLIPTTGLTRPATCILNNPVAKANRNLVVESTPHLSATVPYAANNVTLTKSTSDVSSDVEYNSVIKEKANSLGSLPIGDRLERMVSGASINITKNSAQGKLSKLPGESCRKYSSEVAGLNHSLSDKVKKVIGKNMSGENSVIQDELIGMTKDDLISISSSLSEYIIIRDATTSTTSLVKQSQLTCKVNVDDTNHNHKEEDGVQTKIEEKTSLHLDNTSDSRIDVLHEKHLVMNRIAYDLCCLLSPVQQDETQFARGVVERVADAISSRSVGNIIYRLVLENISKFTKINRVDNRPIMKNTPPVRSQYSLDSNETIKLQALTYACHSVSFQIMSIMTELEIESEKENNENIKDINLDSSFEIENGKWRIDKDLLLRPSSETDQSVSKLDKLLKDFSVARTALYSDITDVKNLNTNMNNSGQNRFCDVPCNYKCDLNGEPSYSENTPLGLNYQAVDYKDRCLENDVNNLRNIRRDMKEIKEIALKAIDESNQDKLIIDPVKEGYCNDKSKEEIYSNEKDKRTQLRQQTARVLGEEFANAITVPSDELNQLITVEAEESAPLLTNSGCMEGCWGSHVAGIVGCTLALWVACLMATSAGISREFSRSEVKEWTAGLLFLVLNDVMFVQTLMAMLVALFFSIKGQLL